MFEHLFPARHLPRVMLRFESRESPDTACERTALGARLQQPVSEDSRLIVGSLTVAEVTESLSQSNVGYG